MIKFFRDVLSFVTLNWIGMVLGLGFAILISIIIALTLSQKSKFLGNILIFIFIVGLPIAGGFLQKALTKVNINDDVPPFGVDESIEYVNNLITDGWTKTNGDYSFNYVKDVKEDPGAPQKDDIIFDITVTDFGNYINFSYNINGCYENINFIIGGRNRLSFDGMLNMTSKYSKTKDVKDSFFGLWDSLIFSHKEYDLNSHQWIYDDITLSPYYYLVDTANYNYADLISLSSNRAFYLRHNYMASIQQSEKAYTNSMRLGAEFVSNELMTYFISKPGVQLSGTSASAQKDICEFYAFLYSNLKGCDYNNNYLVNSDNYWCAPIPQSEQSNYPISSSLKAEYPDLDYFDLYDCDIFFNCKFLKGNTDVAKPNGADDYIEKNDDNTGEIVDVTKVKYDTLKVTFKDKQESGLTDSVLRAHPVTLTLRSSDDIKSVVINSLNKLQSGVTFGLLDNKEYFYDIASDVIVFDDYSGILKLTSNTNKNFNYSWTDNSIALTVKLKFVTSVDMTKVNLVENPVTIWFNGNSEAYSFVFDNNALINTGVSKLVKLSVVNGIYQYSILSRKLIFAPMSGSISLNMTDNVIEFTCGSLNDDKIHFSLSETENNTNKIHVSANISTVKLVSDTFGTGQYNVKCCLISDGFSKTFVHQHSGVSSTCSITPFDSLARLLEDGKTYSFSLTFYNVLEPEVSIVSSYIDFTYHTGMGLEIVYTATAVD